MTDIIADATFEDMAPLMLKEKQVWIDLVSALNEVVSANVDEPLMELENLRQLTADTDAWVLMQTCRMIGFDVSQDIMDFSTAKLLRIVTQLAMYCDQNGTQLFQNFMDLLINSNTNIVYLWTENYRQFYDKPYGALVVDGGTWYKTTHVNVFLALLVDDTSLSNVSLAGQTLFQRVKKLFYQFAPITLIIYKFYFTYIEHLNIGLGVKVSPKYIKKIIVDDAGWLR